MEEYDMEVLQVRRFSDAEEALKYCNFLYGHLYIRYKNGPITEGYHKTGIYFNDKNQKEAVPDYLFNDYEVLYPLMELVCVYASLDGNLNMGTRYFVFSEDIDKYKVLNEKGEFKFYPKEYFMEIKDWVNASDEERNTLVEKASVQKKEAEKLKKLENVTKAITNYVAISKTTHEVKISKFDSIALFVMSFMELIISFILKDIAMVIFGLSLLAMTIAMTIYSSKKTRFNEEYDMDINKYELLTQENKFPLEVLGKIKFIQNKLIILNSKKVDDDIIGLLQQNINLTIALMGSGNYYEENKEVLDEKANELLDNSMKYIDILENDKIVQDNFIKETLSNQIIEAIDQNNKLFNSMIKDHHYLTDFYEKD
jgi:hypothetical protein